MAVMTGMVGVMVFMPPGVTVMLPVLIVMGHSDARCCLDVHDDRPSINKW
jgi:hypothetical protein